MLYQYHCACCNKVVASTDRVCPECGSQNIRSPYGFWVFCIIACLAAAVVFKIVHLYLQDHQSVPTQQTLLDTLNQSEKTS